MDIQEQERFDFLCLGPCVPVQYVRDYYGLNWPLTNDLRRDFEAWRKLRRRPANCGDGNISRFELETFMQEKSVLPKKWMGARLGMEETSLDELLSRLNDLGMRPQRYLVYPDLISEALTEDLASSLPGLKFRTYGDHNMFCERLHADLEKTLGIKVHPLFCATADCLSEYPRLYASHFDCITLAPVSGRHQMWLDFHKPLNLSPDRCSKLFYVENRNILRPFCAGSQEPDDLETYNQFLAGQPNV